MPKKGPGHDVAVYIILCSRQTDVLATNDPKEKIKAASHAAAEVIAYLSLQETITMADVQEISDLQHYLMEHINMGSAEATTKVIEMFELLDALEDSLG